MHLKLAAVMDSKQLLRVATFQRDLLSRLFSVTYFPYVY